MGRRGWSVGLLLVALSGGSLFGLLAGCSTDSSPSAPASQTTYAALVLNEHAINMSLSDPASNTMQLTATPLNIDGALLAGAGQVTYQAADSSVTVSPTGVVTAQYVTPAGGTWVRAILQINRLTHEDSALILVTPTPPPAPINPDSFSIQPVDSAVRAAYTGQYYPQVRAKDQAGNTMNFYPLATHDGSTTTNYIYHLGSSNETIASYNNFDAIALNDTGHVTLYATGWVYGVSVRDSVHFLVGWPLSMNVYVVNSPSDVLFPSNPVIFLGVGGSITWFRSMSVNQDSVDIVFDDSTHVDSAPDPVYGQYSGRGNIHFPAGSSSQPDGALQEARSFPVAGTYHFYDRSYPDIVGTIYVRNNPSH